MDASTAPRVAAPDAPAITWATAEAAAVVPGHPCPVCGDAAAKAPVLDVRTLGAQRRTVTLLRCGTCSVRFFPELAEPLPFSGVPEASAIHHFEAAIGLRGSADCLARIDTSGHRRFLEVGCGTGFTLDYARHVHGWEVLGVDTSTMATFATRELGVPVVHGLLGETDAVQDGAWELVFACEVIEHVGAPAAFLAAVRTALAPDGTFLLRTPAAEGLTPDRTEHALVSILSPGYHAMLHTAASLRRILEAAGFTEIHVLREGDTLHAAASTVPITWDPAAVLDPDELLGYLVGRVDTLPPGAPARLGLLQQLVNARIIAGDHVGAREALDRLDATLVARFGHGLDADADDVPAFAAAHFCAAFMAHALVADAQAHLTVAEERFAAVETAAERATALNRAVNALDPALAAQQQEAQLRRLTLQVLRDPVGAPAAAAVLRARDAAAVPVAFLRFFTLLVGAGALATAGAFTGEARATLGSAVHDDTVRREARWALAMVLLHGSADHGAAAAQFALAEQEAQDDARRWAAAFHAAYARWHGGDRAGAGPGLRAVVDAAAGTDADGPAAAWAGQARGLLAYSG